MAERRSQIANETNKKGRLWLHDGSSDRPRPEYRDCVWCYGFLNCGTDDGKVFRTLNVIDAYRMDCLPIPLKRKLTSGSVIDILKDLFILRAGLHSFGLTEALSSLSAQNLGVIAPVARRRMSIARASMSGSQKSFSTVESFTACTSRKS